MPTILNRHEGVMKLSDLTWKEIEDYCGRKSELIIPVGTCEQPGKHLPLKTDTVIVEAMADALSEKTDILVAPTINYGVNLPCDRLFFGTCSVTENLLQETVKSIMEWWKLQGFKKFYLISAHGDPLHIRALTKADPNAFVLELFDLDLSGFDMVEGANPIQRKVKTVIQKPIKVGRTYAQ